MRDFFISSLEKLIGVVIGFFGIAFGGGYGATGGFFAGLVFLIVGAVNVVLLGGFMYLGLGIYRNTLRSANAIERMAASR